MNSDESSNQHLKQISEKIEAIYNEAIAKLEVLGQERNSLVKERQEAIRGYIRDLEAKKADAIRASIKLAVKK